MSDNLVCDYSFTYRDGTWWQTTLRKERFAEILSIHPCGVDSYVDTHKPYDTGSGIFKAPEGGWAYDSSTLSLPSGYRVDFEVLGRAKKHTFDDTKDWESYYAPPVGPAPTPEDFHQLGHPPQCDCGAEKANTTHARWCSKENL